jgi:hypothetical protein
LSVFEGTNDPKKLIEITKKIIKIKLLIKKLFAGCVNFKSLTKEAANL